MYEVTLALIGVTVVSAYLYSRMRHRYWSSKGISTPPYIAFLGHTHKAGSKDYAYWVEKEVYKLCRSGICGLYDGFAPVLMVGDLDLIKSIMVKDFDHFTDRRVMDFPHENDRTMNDMLSSLNGEAWKDLRSILTPAFTSGKLRGMFDLLGGKVDILVKHCIQESSKTPSIDIKDYASRFIMDAIASCAFGFESNSVCDKDAIFPKRAAMFSDFESIGQSIKLMILLACPKLLTSLNIPIFPKEVLFFNDIVNEAIKHRRNGEKRGDFLDLLLEASNDDKNSKRSPKKVLDDANIVAQSVLFIIAGYETSASTIAFTSFLLAKHPEEQKRLRQELQSIVAEHDGLTYQGIMDSKFLDACVMETLRYYSPIPVTERMCSKSFKVPGTEIILRPGDIVQIPFWCLHRDEQYWPEPEVFRPDRFMPGNKENITNYTFMPFGVGPRNCIGMRFALLETKLAVAKLVLEADLQLVPGHEELDIATTANFLKAEGGVPLHLKPIREE